MDNITTISEILNKDVLSGGMIIGIIGVAAFVGVFRLFLIFCLKDDNALKSMFYLAKGLFYGFALFAIYHAYKVVRPDQISMLTYIITVAVSFGFIDCVIHIVIEIKNTINILRGKENR
jgi:hypothetical protein